MVAALPSPMLLLHGSGLAGVTVTGVPVPTVVTSPNGHWAVVWLAAPVAEAGTLHLVATTGGGSVGFEYRILARRAAAEVAAGLSAADVSDPHAYHGGDLQGILDHPEYLQELGITAVWLTPVVEHDLKSRDYHGYGATDLYRVDPRPGTLAEASRMRRRRCCGWRRE